jgi:phenylpropionate dioxygenase-like ring-hydroxylating dioxygenase large terminal subunit
MTAVETPSPTETRAKVAPLPFGRGFLKDTWYFVETAEALKPGRQARYMLQDEPVLLGRTRSGQVYALRDICPHRAAPLSAGRQVEHAGEGETLE